MKSRPIIKKPSTNATNSQSNNNNNNKSVRFDPAARCILIHPSNGFDSRSSSRSSLTRYTDDDYKRIRKSVKKTVRAARSFHKEHPDGNFDEHQQTLAEAEGNNDAPEHSSRGLEHLRSAEFLEQQMINKDCAIESVLAAQERLDEEEDADNNDNSTNTGNQDALDRRIRDIYDKSSSSDTSKEQLRAHHHRLEQRARHIAASYRVHSRWAVQNALELAAQDERYAEEHVRPALGGELRELERRQSELLALSSNKADTTDSVNGRRGTVSPLHTLATLQESLAMEDFNGEGEGEGDDDNEPNNTVTPPSSLSAATIANTAASRSPSRPGNSAHATSTSSTSRSRRPHAPSRVHPPRPTNWLQHRDSLQLSLESTLDNKTSSSSPSSSEPRDVTTLAEESR